MRWANTHSIPMLLLAAVLLVWTQGWRRGLIILVALGALAGIAALLVRPRRAKETRLAAPPGAPLVLVFYSPY